MWPSIPLWHLEVPKNDLELLKVKSENLEMDLVNVFQCHVQEKYQEHVFIFTDGSKDQESGASGAAFVVQS